MLHGPAGIVHKSAFFQCGTEKMQTRSKYNRNLEDGGAKSKLKNFYSHL